MIYPCNPNKISNNPSKWLASGKLKFTLTLHCYLTYLTYITIISRNSRKVAQVGERRKCYTHTDFILIFSNRVIHSPKRKFRLLRFLSKTYAHNPRNPILVARTRRSTGFNGVNSTILVWIVAPVADGVT